MIVELHKKKLYQSYENIISYVTLLKINFIMTSI